MIRWYEDQGINQTLLSNCKFDNSTGGKLEVLCNFYKNKKSILKKTNIFKDMCSLKLLQHVLQMLNVNTTTKNGGKNFNEWNETHY